MKDIRSVNTLRILQAAEDIRARLAGEFSAVHGLSVNEFLLLSHLAQAQAQKLSRAELAKRMHVSASTVTRMAVPLEKLGLVGREADPRDARLAYVVLTKTGKTRLKDAQLTFAQRAKTVFGDRWNQGELNRLSELLNRLVASSPGNLT